MEGHVTVTEGGVPFYGNECLGQTVDLLHDPLIVTAHGA